MTIPNKCTIIVSLSDLAIANGGGYSVNTGSHGFGMNDCLTMPPAHGNDGHETVAASHLGIFWGLSCTLFMKHAVFLLAEWGADGPQHVINYSIFDGLLH